MAPFAGHQGWGTARSRYRQTRVALTESRFGAGFAEVRVHGDDQTARAAWAIGAKAYTIGFHVVFGASQYQPRPARDCI